MTEIGDVPPGVDPARPTSARLYDYFLGGTSHFPADRIVGEKLKASIPYVADAVLANRGFHGRAAVWMARQGVRQFLDLGSGLPTQNNTHESVHRVIPGARVVYVDIDPMAAALAGRLLTDDGTTAVITADLRDPAAILEHPDLRRLIDTSEPTGLLVTDVLHFFADDEDPWAMVRQYMDAAGPAAGSCLALSHSVGDIVPAQRAQRRGDGARSTLSQAAVAVHPRTRSQVERFFDGLDLVPPYEGAPPSVSYSGMWGAEDPAAAESDGARSFYCGVARRPSPAILDG